MSNVPHGEPYAGKLHVRFDEGAGVPHGGVSLYSTHQWWCRSGGVVAEYAIMRGMRALRNFKPDRCCHLISRIANRAFYLTDEERTRFVERLWRVAKFSGIEVLAYCFMSNHFHLLVHLPEATGGAARGTGHLQRQLLHGALPDAACKSRVHCRRRYREPSFAAAEVSPCGQGKEVGLVSYSTTLTPPLGADHSRSLYSCLDG